MVRPGRREGAQSVWYFRAERLIAVDAMNDAAAYALGKRLIESGKSLPKTAAADPAVNLKEWM